MVGRPLPRETWDPLERRTNGKVTSWATINFIGRKCGIRSALVKKPLSFGQYGTNLLPSMNGGHESLRSLFQSNASFASLTQVSLSNTNFGIASELGGHGDGPLSSCMNFVGLGLVTMTTSTGNNPHSGKGFLVNMVKRLKLGTSLGVLHCGPFGSNIMIRCSTMKNGMKLKFNIGFGMSSLSMPKRLGIGWSNKLKLVASWRKPCSKVLTKLGVLVVLCRRHNLHIEWNSKRLHR